eukprot:TRINITY_DN167_c0_g1_i1.p1 TRINITY_DN167_c0_g1~~TRINITY_DN167_c0_g1_i1.p1  ORF type:complete len:197 (-),score=43.24 TRINITY_DN167_c0_g1_i1:112-702(-)
MFRNTFQSGFFSILYSLGTHPLQLWEEHEAEEGKEVDGSSISIRPDANIQSNVIEVVSKNVSNTYISCPKDPSRTLGIKLPYLVLIVKNLDKFFSFEIHASDDKKLRRRLRCSNYQAETRVKPYICTMPLKLDEGWNYIQIDIADLMKKAYGAQYEETLRLTIHANCRIRRVFFSDRLYPEDELPPEFKLYLPAAE